MSILKNTNYTFPIKKELKLYLKDFLEEEVEDKYFISEKMYCYLTDMTNRNGFVRGNRFKPINIDKHKTAFTITTRAGSRPTDNFVYKDIKDYKIRKLTPLECWRLMGFDDDSFYKAKNSLNEKFYKGRDKSNSQLYKQAGNSIVVQVLEGIFRELFKKYKELK